VAPVRTLRGSTANVSHDRKLPQTGLSPLKITARINAKFELNRQPFGNGFKAMSARLALDNHPFVANTLPHVWNLRRGGLILTLPAWVWPNGQGRVD
jgi:hypothetical protein